MDDVQTLISELEQLVRAGSFSAVAKQLNQIKVKAFPREELVRIANIANRIDQSKLALKLLNPIIRGTARQASPATELETLEYAEALRRIGATQEAIQVLRKMDTAKLPVVNLRWAFCLIAQWRYEQAIPLLRAFIQVTPPSDYTHVIAKVNLAAALVFERMDDEADQVLCELRLDAKRDGHKLLYANCLELTAQLAIYQNKWSEADLSLTEAEAGLPNLATKYAFFVRKWKAISQSLQAKAALPELLNVRKTAVETGDWETVRECDLYTAATQRDHQLALQVYFGTPHLSYRKKITRLMPGLVIPSHSLWPKQSNAGGKIFDAVLGRFDDGSCAMDEGELPHRFLLLLTRDFYRPLSVAGAFSNLFPDEYFNPLGSPNRIYQVVKRTRQWLEKNEMPFRIEESNGTYRLHATGEVSIRVPERFPTLNWKSLEWEKIEMGLVKHTFSKQELIQINNCSVATAKRLLRWATETGLIEVIGSGRGQRYKLAA